MPVFLLVGDLRHSPWISLQSSALMSGRYTRYASTFRTRALHFAAVNRGFVH